MAKLQLLLAMVLLMVVSAFGCSAMMDDITLVDDPGGDTDSDSDSDSDSDTDTDADTDADTDTDTDTDTDVDTDVDTDTDSDTGSGTGSDTGTGAAVCGDDSVDVGMICFDAPQTIGTAEEVRGVDMGDLDNDGDDDVVSVYRGANTDTDGGGGDSFISNGLGSFGAGVAIPLGCCGYERVKIAKISDSLADVVAVDTKEYNFKSARGNGDGTFNIPWESLTFGADIFDIVLVDTNTDGYKDFIHGNDEFLVRHLGTSGESFTYDWLSEDYLDFPMKGMAHGDVDENSTPDVVATCHEDLVVSIILLTNVGTVNTVTNLATTLAPLDAAIGDFDDDSHADVAITTATNVAVFFGDGSGTSWSAALIVDVPGNTNSIVVADIDADDIDDIVTVGSTGTLTISISDGVGGFEDGVDITVGLSPQDLAVGEVNEDGSPDLAIAAGTGTIVLVSNP